MKNLIPSSMPFFMRTLLPLVCVLFLRSLAYGQCHANFTFTTDSTGKCTFTNTSVGGDSCYWNLGFGTFTGASPNAPVIKQYPYNGYFNVCLAISDSSGCRDTICKNVVISGVQCKARFIFSPDPQGRIRFYNQSSGGQAAEFTWHFGDTSVSNETEPLHNYATANSYTACLVMKTPDGCYDSVCRAITGNLPNPTCNAKFDYTIDPLNTSLFHFQNLSTTTGIASPTYKWTFAEGPVSNSFAPDYTFQTLGPHQVTLTVSGNGCSAFICKVVDVPPPSRCFIRFQPVRETSDHRKILFHNRSVGSKTASYTWHFGDGGTSTDASPVHQYAQDGNYTVTVIMQGDSCTDSINKVIYVGPNSGPCNARFTTAHHVLEPSVVHFTNQSTYTGATGVLYKWIFGDGLIFSHVNPIHQFSNKGTYQVILEMYTYSYCVDSVFSTVTISGPCTADFNVSVTPDTSGGSQGIAVFNNTSSGSYNKVRWSFGDSTFADSGNNPVHVYMSAGNYTVCLMISDSTGKCADTLCKTVNIFHTGMEERELAKSFRAYPVPFSGTIKADLSWNSRAKAEVSVYDMMGLLKYEASRDLEAGPNTLAFDLDQLSHGVYLLQLKVGNTIITKKISK